MAGILAGSKRVCLRTVALFLLSLGVASSPAETLAQSELEKAARKEGKIRIVVYPSLRSAAQAFQARYGIEVEGTYVGDPPILRTVSQESDAGIFAIDVFATNPGPTGSKLNKWAMPFKPADHGKVAKVMKDLPAGWHQIPLFVHVVGAAYHTELVPADKVPRSIYDLLKPEFKGKIISRTPWLGSNFLVHILSYYTWFAKDMGKWSDYWSRFRQNVGRYEAKWPALHAAVGLKEFSMAIFTLPYAPTTFGRSYSGLAYSTFKEGGIWWPNMATIHRKGPHPNAAKLFVNFLVGDEGQRIFSKEGLIPANEAIAPKDDIKNALEGIRLFNGELQSILVREVVENGNEWKAKIQKIYK